ncbi:MAG TPA: BlaI/MecI/CopY family transcriptional regulator, partial [Gemmatimonadaceae bacterium]|nr:BlaI/MecI/CopY family transcriptional regulator [Gemmatimonadaceae bacterium]
PTDAELELLTVLWERGPSTVREVHDEVNSGRPVGYTTVLKLLQIMFEKRLVKRDARDRSHVYRAARPREGTQRALLDDLVERAFGGSASELVQRALAARRATPDELREIRRLVDRIERGDA